MQKEEKLNLKKNKEQSRFDIIYLHWYLIGLILVKSFLAPFMLITRLHLWRPLQCHIYWLNFVWNSIMNWNNRILCQISSQQINIFPLFWFTENKYVLLFKKSKQYSESCQCYNKQQKKADRKSDKRWQFDSFNKTKQILIVSYLLISVSRINKASILIMRIRRFSWIYVLSKTKVLLYQTKF